MSQASCSGADLGFQKGGANKAFTYMAKKSDNYNYKHTQHAEHALSRGVWGYAPTGKFCKYGLLKLNLVVILSENNITLFIPLLHHSLFIAKARLKGTKFNLTE